MLSRAKRFTTTKAKKNSTRPLVVGICFILAVVAACGLLVLPYLLEAGSLFSLLPHPPIPFLPIPHLSQKTSTMACRRCLRILGSVRKINQCRGRRHYFGLTRQERPDLAPNPKVN